MKVPHPEASITASQKPPPQSWGVRDHCREPHVPTAAQDPGVTWAHVGYTECAEKAQGAESILDSPVSSALFALC